MDFIPLNSKSSSSQNKDPSSSSQKRRDPSYQAPGPASKKLKKKVPSWRAADKDSPATPAPANKNGSSSSSSTPSNLSRFTDKELKGKIRDYLEVNRDKEYIDPGAMAEELREKHENHKYRRVKLKEFKRQVNLVFDSIVKVIPVLLHEIPSVTD